MVQKNTRKKRRLQTNKKKHVWLSRRLHIEGRLNKGPLLQRNHRDENEAKQTSPYHTTVLDFDGNARPSPISIVQDQQGPNVHFLDICAQIMQLYYLQGSVSMILASYRKFPHIETTVSTSCKCAVLYNSQLYRFAYYRCTRRDYFVDAACRIMRDTWLHGYDLKFLRPLYHFQTTFWRISIKIFSRLESGEDWT